MTAVDPPRPARGRWRPRPRLSTVALGIATVLGTLLLLWGADQAARWGAENLLARTVQDATGTAARPSVQVHGGLVLAQVLRGRYDDVTVTLRDVQSGPLQADVVHAQLTGVRLSFHDVLLQHQPDDLVLGTATQQATLRYADLDRYLAATGRPLSAGPAAAAEGLRLTGRAQVLATSVTAWATERLTPQVGGLGLDPTEVHSDTELDPTAAALLRQRFTLTVPLDLLPFGQQVTEVRAGESALVLHTRDAGVLVRR